MKTISYRGDEGEFQVTLRRPTIADETRRVDIFRKLQEAIRDGSLSGGIVSAMPQFVICIANAIDAVGLPYELPTIDSTKDQIVEAFRLWFNQTPMKFGEDWYNAANEMRMISDPKANRIGKNARSRSGKQQDKSPARGQTAKNL